MLTKTKTITVHGKVYHVYSLDGRIWASRRRDLSAFARRYQRELEDVQKAFSRIDTAEQYRIEYP